MKNSLKVISLLAGASLLVLACDPEEVVTAEISVNQTTLTFSAGSPVTQTIEVTSTVAWEASTDVSWLSIEPAAGSGDASVAISAEVNVAEEGAAAAARSATIEFAIEGQTVTVEVTQDGETLIFAAVGEPTSVPAAGATVVVTVEANQTYTFSSSADWCTYVETKAVKTEYLSFTVAASTTVEARTATVTLTPASGSAVTVTIQQEGLTVLEGISTAEDFAVFVEALKSGNFERFNTGTDKTIKLLADLNVGTLEEPLGTLPADYTFDGGSKTITYAISTDSTAFVNLGLFSDVEGKVANLNVAGSIKSSAPAGSGTFHLGSVAAYLGSAGVIENCTSTVSITGDTRLTHHMGGMVGYAAAGATVKSCVNEGALTVSIDGASNASQMGGIIGHIEGSATVENCENKGTIVYEGTGTGRLGGIVGYINNLVSVSITGCTNSANMTITQGAATSWTYMGGITGYFGTPTDGGAITYENCSNTGNLSHYIASDDTSSRVRMGGIMAQGGHSSTASTYNLTNCSNSGTLSASSVTTDRTVLGGIVGLVENTSAINLNSCTFSGTLSSPGGGKVGGMVGALASTASTFTNINVTEDALLTSENGFKTSCVGIIGGQNSAFTTAVTGKVAGTIVNGATETVITNLNYQDNLFGGALGDGASTEGVTCDVTVTLISSAEELAALLANTEALATEGAIYQLAADIDLLNAESAGTDGTFKGTFDGCNYAIKNATFTKALIAQNDGTIKNIKFESVNIKDALIGTSNGTVSGITVDANSTFTYDAQTSSANLGAVVGTNNGTVSNCSSAAVSNVEITGFGAECNVGGVVGASYGLVEGCSFSGTLSLNQTAPTKSLFHTLAGVVGLASGTSGNIIVQDCSNTGTVSVTYATAVYFNTAGVVGSTNFAKPAAATDQGIISGCSNTGAISMRYISGGSGAYPMCGGVCGTIEGYVQDCWNDGSISLTCDSESSTWTCAKVGGVAAVVFFGGKGLTNKSNASISVSALLAGGTANNRGAANINCSCFAGVIAAAGPYTESNDVVFENCVNEATLDITANSTTGTPNHYAGAVMGFSTGKLYNCSNTGSIRFSSPVAYSRVAGITGGTKSDVESCTNSGAVTADLGTFATDSSVGGATASSPTGKFATYVSGIVGDSRLATAVNITSCSNSGTITSIMDQQTAVTSIYNSYVTGILACNSTTDTSTATITSCTNTGSLVGTGGVNTIITADLEGGKYQDPVATE